VTTIKQTLGAARQRLQSSSASPAVDASVLLCHVLDCAASHLVAWPDKELTPAQQSQFAELLDQRAQGRPVAYITGEKEFWSLSLRVSPAVLIPRPETETLVEFVLETFSGRETLDVADLGTGSGAIACALAREHSGWNVVATDASAPALEIARTNASCSELRNIRFQQGDWFDALDDLKFDVIISNPPYVADDDPHLERGDLRFEPVGALAAGERGMDAISHLAREANRFLKPGGWLVVEHGYDQKQAVYDCFDQAGFDGIVQRSDLAGIPRMTAGRQPGTNT
jgi:release factor glutamine methyltransferase